MTNSKSGKKLSAKRVLFLGYNRKQTSLIGLLSKAGCEVDHSADPIDEVDYDLIVSFGYRHIIRQTTLARITCPIINLHISYLPYNKGAHPGFWSFFDGTPSGVTIHLIDGGLDTGPIIYQRKVAFDAGETTFLDAHKRLIYEIEDLFVSHLDELLSGDWTAVPQCGDGTKHYVKDLPSDFAGWTSEIEPEITRLRKIGEK
jgi:methionyl-tRNA formyltransferase